MRPIENGIALLELVLGLAILGILLGVAVETISVATQTKSMPLIHARAARLAQDTMDAVMSRKFDENTPAGGVPHCGASGAPACAGIVAGDSGMDDVGDFNGTVDSTSEPPSSSAWRSQKQAVSCPLQMMPLGGSPSPYRCRAPM